MSQVFNFQNEEECCPTCRLVSDFTQFILDSASKEEVEDLVNDLVGISKEIGYKQALVDSINANIDTLRELDGDSCCCDICDPENCGLDK
jgi:hypothetical protein